MGRSIKRVNKTRSKKFHKTTNDREFSTKIKHVSVKDIDLIEQIEEELLEQDFNSLIIKSETNE